MNKRILALAIPNVISNITIPLVGMIDIAIAGRLIGDAAIGAIAIGTTIFGLIYWNCAFIRMGASGMTAQALGARNLQECVNILSRSITVSLILALLLLVFQVPVARVTMGLMSGSDQVMDMVGGYFYSRVWAAPATISLYAIHGWFIGMQNAKTPMYVSIVINIVNAVASYGLVKYTDLGVAGIGWGTAIAQYSGLLLSVWVLIRHYGRVSRYFNIRETFQPSALLRFFNVNKDIFLRNVCNVAVYSFFTIASSGFGDTLLATNAILIQLFTFFSYMADGYAYAAEALTGKFIGAGNVAALRKCIRYLFVWSFAIAVLFVAIYYGLWDRILYLFTDSAEIAQTAGEYIIWIIIVPLIGFAPFLMDGIMIGATRTAILRNSMFFSTVLFFGLYYSLLPAIGYDALWLAFVVFLASRGLLQYFMADRLRSLYRQAESFGRA